MINISSSNKEKSNERGFASIVITLVLITVLALMTIGFAQLARREQQNALTKQLASQANYAAETGINDAVKLIQHNIITDGNGTDCLDLSTYPDTSVSPARTYTNVISPPIANDISYSCASIKTKLPDLVKDPLPSGTGWTIIFKTDPTKPQLKSIDINWESTSPTGKVLRPTLGVNPIGSSWNSPAVLQVSITPIRIIFGTASLSDMRNQTFTTTLYPINSASSTSYIARGVRLIGGCNGTISNCKATIDNLDTSGVPAGGSYLVHVLALYDDSKVTINAANSVGAVPTHLNFEGAQAIVDVTGRAHEVLKRLRVRVPLNGSSAAETIPNYAIEAQDICKRITTEPNANHFIKADNSGDAGAGDPCNLN
jgi:hypothetical protein